MDGGWVYGRTLVEKMAWYRRHLPLSFRQPQQNWWVVFLVGKYPQNPHTYRLQRKERKAKKQASFFFFPLFWNLKRLKHTFHLPSHTLLKFYGWFNDSCTPIVLLKFQLPPTVIVCVWSSLKSCPSFFFLGLTFGTLLPLSVKKISQKVCWGSLLFVKLFRLL